MELNFETLFIFSLMFIVVVWKLVMAIKIKMDRRYIKKNPDKDRGRDKKVDGGRTSQ